MKTLSKEEIIEKFEKEFMAEGDFTSKHTYFPQNRDFNDYTNWLQDILTTFEASVREAVLRELDEEDPLQEFNEALPKKLPTPTTSNVKEEV